MPLLDGAIQIWCTVNSHDDIQCTASYRNYRSKLQVI